MQKGGGGLSHKKHRNVRFHKSTKNKSGKIKLFLNLSSTNNKKVDMTDWFEDFKEAFKSMRKLK